MCVPPQMCQTRDDCVMTAWTVEWESLTDDLRVPVLTRECTWCHRREYASREPVAA